MLLFENGPRRGAGVEVNAGVSYTIGRDAACDIVVQDELVSRQHCKIKEFKGAWFVRDSESRNGVLLNDRPITQAQINFGDKLQLGGQVLTFLEESLEQIRKERMLGGYLLREHIGRGGMGTVYRALQVSLDREVALKILSPDLVKDPAFVDQFRREARAAGQLNHPNIVQVYDVGEEGSTFFYSMEFVEGGSIEDRLRKDGRITPAETIDIAIQAAQALEFAESRSIVHRDLKPDNLMITLDGRIKLADLGLALSLSSKSTDQARQPILGTPHFISPEQALRRDVDIRSDIYSLGATLYRMLTGTTVFHGASAEEIIRKAVREPPRSLRDLAPEVPEKLAAVVHRMLEKDPQDRFASATELRESLEALQRHPGRTIALWAASVVAVLALGWVGYLLIRGPEKEIQRIVEEDVTSKQAAFAAKSELEKTQIELRAVRSYYELVVDGLLANERAAGLTAPVPELPGNLEPARTAADREVLRDLLQGWLEDPEFQFLDIGEREQAERILQALRQTIEEDQRLLAAAEVAEAEQIATLSETVNQALAVPDFATAVSAIAALQPTPRISQSLLDASRRHVSELRRRVESEIERIYLAHRQEIEDAAARRDLDRWVRACEYGLKIFGDVPSSLPENDAALLSAPHQWLTQQHQVACTERDRALNLADRDDLRTLITTFGDAYRTPLLGLDLASAAAALENGRLALKGDRYAPSFQPAADFVARGADVLERFLGSLERGELPSEPKVRAASMRTPAELVGFERDSQSLKLRVKAAVGETSMSIKLQSFATPDGLRQLLWNRMTLSPEETLDCCGLMVELQVAQWAEAILELRKSVDGYKETTGWNEALSIGIATDSEVPDLLTTIDSMMRDLPREHADRAEAMRDLALAEMECFQGVQTALSPFLMGSSSIGWTAAARQIQDLFREHRSRHLLRAIYPLIDSSFQFPLVGG